MRNYFVFVSFVGFLLVCILLAVSQSCSRQPLTISASPASATGTGPAGGALLINEGERWRLAQWQRDKFADPGWAVPASPPAGQELSAPAQAEAAKLASAMLDQPATLLPRGMAAGQRSVSWSDQFWPPITEVAQGEYRNVLPDGTPAFGCNNDPSNSANGHALDDVIAPYANPARPPRALDYLNRGLSSPNFFNRTGGTGNDAVSAVYQLFASNREADPNDPGSLAEFGEIDYRADLAPGVGPGGDCSAAQPFLVYGKYWRAFNRELSVPNTGYPEGSPALPAIYDVLIAPSSEMSDFMASLTGTTGRYQQFYCGTLPGCFGGGWLTSVESSASDFEPFNEMVAQASQSGFFIRPLFGVLLKRWQQGAPGGSAAAWDGLLGWPVFGPIAYRNFQPTLNIEGTFRALGMWYEHGFIWWVDYDQELYPNSTDKALCYLYTGPNVYALSETDPYVKLGSAVCYSDRGPLGVSVVAEKVLAGENTRYEALPASR